MPRPLRINSAGFFFHVMARGNNRQPVFQQSADYTLFEGLLSQTAVKFGLYAHAYCLMGNHIHLLLQTGKGGLSAPMDWLLGVYAQKFNRRAGRIGHLFQGRFLSKMVADERYLLSVVRYIHRNPVRAGLAPTAEEYPWSSMQAYLGIRCISPWLHTEKIAAYFPGIDGPERLRRFTALPGAEPCEGLEWPKIRSWYYEDPEESEAPQVEIDSPIVQQILAQISREFRCSLSTLLSRQQRATSARSSLIIALRREAGLPAEQIARLLGYRSRQSVYNTIARVRLAARGQPPSI